MTGQYVSMAEVRDLLKAESERRAELLPMQKNALSVAESYPLAKEQADELIAKLSAIDFLQDQEPLVYKIADTLPRFSSEVRSLCAKERLVRPLDAGMVQQILDAVAPYVDSE